MTSGGLRMLSLAAPWEGGEGNADESSILGLWKLESYLPEDAATGEIKRQWGVRPKGYLVYLPDGHMSVTITAEASVSVATNDGKYDIKKAQLRGPMAAYAGTYSVQLNGKIVHHVDLASMRSWVGSEQLSVMRLDGDTLTMRTQPIRNASDGREYIYLMEWRRMASGWQMNSERVARG